MNGERWDHGILNVPLAKRGNIDAEIDKWKRDNARQAKADARAHAARMNRLRPEAKRLVADLPDARLAALAAKRKVAPRRCRSMLNSAAHWEPERVIRALQAEANK